MSYPTPSFRTGNQVLNDTMMGFTSAIEFLNMGVNHDYEQKTQEVNGMPTGGAISVRRQGFRVPQFGRVNTLSGQAQATETISVSEADIVGDSINYSPKDFYLDRNNITDTEHYQMAASIALAINSQCYKRLGSNVDLVIGSSDTASLSADLVLELNQACTQMRIPKNGTLFTNVKDYAALNKAIVTTPVTFDQELNQLANQNAVTRYGSINLLESSSLLEESHTAGTASANSSIEFKELVSEGTAFGVSTISLQGATQGQTVVAGDVLTFATTKRATPDTHKATTVKLTLTVQPDANGATTYTADANGDISDILVKGYIMPYDVSNSVNKMFATVLTAPAQGESVKIEGNHKKNHYTTAQGFTFATILMQNLQPIPVGGMGGNGQLPFYSGQTRLMRDKKNALINPASEINLSINTDVDTLQYQRYLRLSVFPAYHVFHGLNVSVITAA